MKTIDFSVRTWGHNVEVFHADDADHCTAFVWCTPGPRIGDRVKWRTNYGHCVLSVDDVHWRGNVEDMYEVELTVIERITK